MSDVLTGSASNVTTPLVARIIALANNGSGAIRATTVAPHLFGSGDSVAVAVTSSGTPVVVGTFTIAVIDSTHFDLVGSTYTATGVGNASDLSLTPQIQVPTDGDTFSLRAAEAKPSVSTTLTKVVIACSRSISVPRGGLTFNARSLLSPEFRSAARFFEG